MHTPKRYRLPVIYNAKRDVSKRWYIEFYYLYPGSPDRYKRFKEDMGMNKIKSYQERMDYARCALEFLTEKLKNGFDPFAVVRLKSPELQPFLGMFKEFGIIRDLMGKNASKSQRNTYNEVHNRFMAFIEHQNWQNKAMIEFTVKEAKEFKKWCLFVRDLSPKTTNNSITHLGMFWDRAIEEEIATINPWRQVVKAKLRDKPIKSSNAVRFCPITNEEMNTIFSRLKQKGESNYINFLSFIYYAWARPVEILRLKISDLEMNRGLIRFDASKTKNGQSAYVQIVDPFMEILKAMDLQKYPADYYIFSANYKPGPTRLSKNNPSRRWLELVKNDMHINKDLYALKHTGNIEILLNNKGTVDLKWQQQQNRHSSTAMTDRYTKKLGAYFVDVANLNFRSLI